jgi:DnaJ-class molecular chaperone
MEFRDYYATLGVPKTASDADIKRAYRKLARKFHPDLNPGDKTAEARFKEVNEAHEVLGDPDKRRKYDELGANWRAYEQAPPPGAEAGGWSPFTGGGPAGGGASYRTMSPEEVQEMFGDADPFSDFFHTFFGGAPRAGGGSARSRTARPRRGRDVESTVDLTLEDAFSGTTRRVALTRDGQTRTVDVRIPAGVKDGARVRAAGEGEPAPPGGTAGDLFLGVRILPHNRFERRGQDLRTRIQVPVTTAVLGGEVPVETLGGSTLRLRVPELTRSGRVFRLRGHGMPQVGKPDERGDLFAVVEIAMPPQLTPEARQHYEALKALDAAGQHERDRRGART